MTRVIKVRNVNEAFVEGITHLLEVGERRPSRNGTVIVAPHPVITEYLQPTERVLLSPLRRANPFFHLMESLWMLAGRNDVEFVKKFNKRISSYSDDGVYFHGAYGHRWKVAFGTDQISKIIRLLHACPNSRRAVLTMWSSGLDLRDEEYVLDVPCNTQAYFGINNGKLDMTVTCRSNDAVWGAYGANVVHFSVLQEYVAAGLGVEVGVYRQFSNNFHAYTDVYSEEKLEAIVEDVKGRNLYTFFDTYTVPVVRSFAQFNYELGWFFESPPKEEEANTAEECVHINNGQYSEPFFREVVVPMYLAWLSYKRKDSLRVLAFLSCVSADDWRIAARYFLGAKND